jgi:serine/threonine protein phosphatase PrpC
MSKPTPKLLRSTHHAALKFSHVVHTSSLGSASSSSSSSGMGGSLSIGNGVGNGVASVRSSGVVARRIHDSVTGGGAGAGGAGAGGAGPSSGSNASASGSTTQPIPGRTKEKRRVGNGRTSPVSVGVISSTGSSSSSTTTTTHEPVRGEKSMHSTAATVVVLPHSSKRPIIPSNSNLRTISSRYALSLVQSFALSTTTTTTALLPPPTNNLFINVPNPNPNPITAGVYLDPPPFPLKLQQPVPSEGWLYVYNPTSGRSSPPQSQSRSLDTPRSSTQDLNQSSSSYQPIAFPPSQSGSRFNPSPGVASVSTSTTTTNTSDNSSADISTPPSSLVSRKTASLVFHPGAYGLAKKRHQPSPSINAGGGDTFISPPDEFGNQTLLRSIQVGEDAYFLRNDSLGIADGVGGWSNRKKKRQIISDQGDDDVNIQAGYADPGMFARLIMGFCEDSLTGYWDRRDEEWLTREGEEALKSEGEGGISNKTSSDSNVQSNQDDDNNNEWANRARDRVSNLTTNLEKPSRRPLSPIEIMQRGFERTMSVVKAERIEGSSTALVAVLEDNQLRVANLGDCACMVIRNGEIVFRTIEMQHSFNFPKQLGGWARDEPMKDAELYTIKVEKNDIVLLSSDGVVDNLVSKSPARHHMASSLSLRHLTDHQSRSHPVRRRYPRSHRFLRTSLFSRAISNLATRSQWRALSLTLLTPLQSHSNSPHHSCVKL